MATRLVVKSFGEVEPEELEKLVAVAQECYSRLEPQTPSLVDFQVFERSSTMSAFLAKEKQLLGVASSEFEEGFFATHDAWRGVPRVMICLEKLRCIPPLVARGGLRHEVAHTVLHGSPEYYIFPLPKPLRLIGKLPAAPRGIATNLLYLISIAVKDYEVTRLLYRGGCVEDQVAYSLHFLSSWEEEQQAWQAVQADPFAKALFLTSLLKSLCCAAPLTTDSKYGGEVGEAIEKYLNNLPTQLSAAIKATLDDALPNFGEDTHINVDTFSRAVAMRLVEPLLSTV